MKDSAVIIVAAGSGKRFGSKTPKQFLLLNKLPVFLWSVQAFRKVQEFSQFVAVVPADMLGTLTPYRKKYGIEFVAGGKERFDSVKAGLQALRPGIEFVAIHDGARPLITPEIIRQGLAAARKDGASVVAVGARDTIKIRDERGRVKETVPRSTVWLAQTPQTFKRRIIERAYRELRSDQITDDAQAVELIGGRVTIVPGDYRNLKITDRADLQIARLFLRQRDKEC